MIGFEETAKISVNGLHIIACVQAYSRISYAGHRLDVYFVRNVAQWNRAFSLASHSVCQLYCFLLHAYNLCTRRSFASVYSPSVLDTILAFRGVASILVGSNASRAFNS